MRFRVLNRDVAEVAFLAAIVSVGNYLAGRGISSVYARD
jgi:hypothetical protein